mgnify:CR=1 FL=1
MEHFISSILIMEAKHIVVVLSIIIMKYEIKTIRQEENPDDQEHCVHSKYICEVNVFYTFTGKALLL